MVSRRQLARDAWANLRFRLHGSTDQGTDELRERILDAIAGQRVVDLARMGPTCSPGSCRCSTARCSTRRYAHQDAGRPGVHRHGGVAGAGRGAGPGARVDGGIGMRSEVRDGVYTGKPAGPFTYREGKAVAIRELAEREGIDLAESYAYSDSESDLPMMRAVGHPVAVNPDRALERVAREEGWRIMRFDRLGPAAEVGRARVGGVLLVGGGGGYAPRAPAGRAAQAACRAGSSRLRPGPRAASGPPRRRADLLPARTR